jgi:hypothetical protein
MVRGPTATRLRAEGRADAETVSADTAVQAVLQASEAPGLAPWIGSRVGVGYGSDAGLSYTGRAVRLDARKAWIYGAWALSVGAGLGAVLSRQTHADLGGETAGNIRTHAYTGFGWDVPVLVGWRSSPDVVQAWLGLRGGHERLGGALDYAPDDRDATAWSLDATARRWYVGPLVGISAGVEPVWVAFELAAAYEAVSGDLREATSAQATELTRTPSPLPRSGHLEFRSAGYALTPSAAFTARF